MPRRYFRRKPKVLLMEGQKVFVRGPKSILNDVPTVFPEEIQKSLQGLVRETLKNFLQKTRMFFRGRSKVLLTEYIHAFSWKVFSKRPEVFLIGVSKAFSQHSLNSSEKVECLLIENLKKKSRWSSLENPKASSQTTRRTFFRRPEGIFIEDPKFFSEKPEDLPKKDQKAFSKNTRKSSHRISEDLLLEDPTVFSWKTQKSSHECSEGLFIEAPKRFSHRGPEGRITNDLKAILQKTQPERLNLKAFLKMEDP